VLEEFLAAEVLPIGAVEIAGADRLIREVECVFKDRKPRHQPCRQGRKAAAVLVNFAEAFFQEPPVDLLRQAHQFVRHVDHLVETRTEKVLFSRLAPFDGFGHHRLPFATSNPVNQTSPQSETEI